MAGVMGHLINTVFFWKAHSHGCQAKVDVGDTENPDSAILKFRRLVNSAAIIPEMRRRAYFETPQDIVKRKLRSRVMQRVQQRRRGGQPKTLADKRAEVAKAKEGAEAYKERVLQRAKWAERAASNQARLDGGGSSNSISANNASSTQQQAHIQQPTQQPTSQQQAGDLSSGAAAAAAAESTATTTTTTTTSSTMRWMSVTPRTSSRSTSTAPPTISKSAASMSKVGVKSAAGVEKGAVR